MGEWRTIDTAPRDGRPFMALNDDLEMHVSKIDTYGRLLRRSHQQRSPQKFIIEDGKKILVEETFSFDTDWSVWTKGYEFKPTHWMPLPAPPTETAKQLESEER